MGSISITTAIRGSNGWNWRSSDQDSRAGARYSRCARLRPFDAKRRLPCAARDRRYQRRDLVARGICAIARQQPTLPALLAIDRGERHVDAAFLYTTRPAISWILAKSSTRHSMPSSARDPAGQSASNPSVITNDHSDLRQSSCPVCPAMHRNRHRRADECSADLSRGMRCPAPSASCTARSPRRPSPTSGLYHAAIPS
jgi:hypothetical protein